MSKKQPKLGIVIPTYKEKERIQQILPTLLQYGTVVVVDDKSKDATGIIARDMGAIVPYHYGRVGYGRSLKEGLILAYYSLKCDYVLQMDADHPFEYIPNFLELIDKFHVVKGWESPDNWRRTRKVANDLVHNTLRIGRKIHHPTCGFVLWDSEVLEHIPWKVVRAKDDAIHIELLYWAERLGSQIGEVPFEGHVGERSYGLRRSRRWFWTFWRIWRRKYLFFWKSDWENV